MKFKTNEIGRSMVEMMGYMAVAMAVIIAVGKIVTNAFDEHKYSQASIQLGDLAVAISKAGAMEKDYSQVDFLDFVPTSYRVAGTKVFHVFGGEVLMGALDEEEDKFYITFKNLKRKQCIELAMKEWQRNENVDLYAIGVNSTFLYWPVYRNNVGSASLPMTRAKLAGKDEDDDGLCDLDTGNTVTWIFN